MTDVPLLSHSSYVRRLITGKPSRLGGLLQASTLSLGLGATTALSPLAALGILGGFGIIAAATIAPLGLAAGVLAARNLTDLLASPISAGHASSLDPSGILGVALIIAAAVRVFLLRRSGVRRPVAMAALGLLAWFLVALVTFGFRVAFARELLRSLSIIALAVVIITSRTPRLRSRLPTIVLAIGVVPALVALLQVALHVHQFVHGEWRSAATFAQSNTAAMAFAICTIIAFWCRLRGRRHHGYLGAFFLLAVISTGSMGGIVQTATGMLVVWYYHLRTRGTRLGAFALIGIIIAGFAFSPIGEARLQELMTTHSPSTAAQGDISNSTDWRFLNWSLLLREWSRRPIYGAGLGSTTEIGLVTPLDNLPHNDYIRLLVETGVSGFLYFGVLVLQLLRNVRARRNADPDSLSYASLTYALLIASLVLAFATDVSLDTAPLYTLTALIAGLFAPEQDRTGEQQALRSASPLSHAPYNPRR